MQDIISLFEEFYNETPREVNLLSGGGSNRTYYRLFSSNQTLIGVKGTSLEENNAFVEISKQLERKQICVPAVYAENRAKKVYLQEDLGAISLFDKITTDSLFPNHSQEVLLLLEQVICDLPKIQFEGKEEFDFSHCYPEPFFDKKSILRDLNYFKYYFLLPSGISVNEYLLDLDFDQFASTILESSSASVFMFRDFQSRNIMIHKDQPYYIDFQGGREGLFLYDLVSFLWQAKAQIPTDLKLHLIELYKTKVATYLSKEEVERIDADIQLFILLRLLQVLGAYGFRGYLERKKHFLESIPYALEQLEQVLLAPFMQAYPYLKKVLTILIKIKKC